MRIPKHGVVEIPMDYAYYLKYFPNGHKRRNVSKEIRGFLLKQDDDNLFWITMDEYNKNGRKIYGDKWINFEDR